MSEKQEETKKRVIVKKYPNQLYITVSEGVYKKVYALSKETGLSMSEVGRLSLEKGLNETAEILSQLKSIKAGELD